MKRNTKATTKYTYAADIHIYYIESAEKQGHKSATKTIKYVNSKIPLQTIIMHVVYQIVLFYLILNSKHSLSTWIEQEIDREREWEKAKKIARERRETREMWGRSMGEWEDNERE